MGHPFRVHTPTSPCYPGVLAPLVPSVIERRRFQRPCVRLIGVTCSYHIIGIEQPLDRNEEDMLDSTLSATTLKASALSNRKYEQSKYTLMSNDMLNSTLG